LAGEKIQMEKKENNEKQKPEYRTKHGAVDGVIWANEKEGSNGKFTSYTIYIKKSFTRDDGQTWEVSKGYFAQDIDNLQTTINDIKKYLQEKKVQTKSNPKPKE